MVRSRQADSPFAFQLGPQQYVLRTALGGAETARLDWDAELLDDLIALRSPNRQRSGFSAWELGCGSF